MTIWTAEMNDYLRKLHTSGMVSRLVAVEINARFGVNITRNAAIGKAHRLGLIRKKRGSPSKPVSQKPKPRKPRRNFKTTKKPMPHINGGRASQAKAKAPAAPQRITLMDLTPYTCRWPIGDPQRKNFYFCGKQAQTTSPYCQEHERDAYNTKATEKDRRRANAQAPMWSR